MRNSSLQYNKNNYYPFSLQHGSYNTPARDYRPIGDAREIETVVRNPYKLYTDKFEESFEPKITNIGLIDANDKMIYFKDIDLINISSDDYKIFFETKDKLIETTQYTYFNKIQLVEFIEFISAELQDI